MTNGLVLAFLVLQVASGSPPSLAAFAGKWVTTAVPPPGEAPMIAPTFTVDVVDNDVTVTIAAQGQAEHYPAKVFRTQTGEAILMFTRSIPRGGSQTVIIRPLPGGQVRFETFTEFKVGPRPSNDYYAENFKKATPLDQ